MVSAERQGNPDPLAREWADRTAAHLQPLANPGIAADMARYMKYNFAFLGVKSPERRKAQKEIFKPVKKPEADTVIDYIDLLWQLPGREYQYVALDALKRYIRKPPSGFNKHIERWITSKSWWDTVDSLAVHGAGKYLTAHPSETDRLADRWAVSTNLWLRRTALIFQLGYKEATDWPRLQRYIMSMAEEKEFFIRKAIGWALREYSKSDPVSVARFLEQTDLSGLSKREASRYLPK